MKLTEVRDDPRTVKYWVDPKNPRRHGIDSPWQGAPGTESFVCTERGVTSALGCPEKVPGTLILSKNRLSSFEHITPDIGKGLELAENEYRSLVGIHHHVKKIGGLNIGYLSLVKNDILEGGLGLFMIEHLGTLSTTTKSINEPSWVKIINKHLMSCWKTLPRKEAMYNCQEELLTKGWDDFAKA